MLEAVDVDISLVQGDVRLDIVAEFDDLDLQAVFFGHFLDHFHDLRMRARGYPDFQRFVRSRRRRGLGRFGFAAASRRQSDHEQEAKNEGQRFFGNVHE